MTKHIESEKDCSIVCTKEMAWNIWMFADSRMNEYHKIAKEMRKCDSKAADAIVEYIETNVYPVIEASHNIWVKYELDDMALKKEKV